MKKLLTLLFSVFLLSSTAVFADDISDFQIEGMSIGDSLLDYMTEEEILEEIELNKNDYSYFNEPHKYVEIYFWEVLPTYDNGLSVFIKNNSTNQYISNKNEKYIILSIYGMMHFVEDFDGCIVKRDEIVEELSMMFPNARKTEVFFKHHADPSGNSIVDAVYFEHDSGAEIETSCENFEETFRIKNNLTEGLSVSISSAEITSWLRKH
jgi:hypothetical protein